MKKVSVDLDIPSPYIEPESRLYRWKRKLTYRFDMTSILRHQPSEASFDLLEIGTGSGYFLAFIQEAFVNARLYGLEYDPRLLAVTNQRVPQAHCIHGNAEAFDFEGKKFDIIASFQVIEHLYTPEAMLANVISHLKPGGVFILTTPNLDGLGARIMKKKWHGYRDDHVSLKGMQEWKNLLEHQGFETQYCGSTFFSGIPLLNHFPLGIFNWMLLAAFGMARWRHGESFVGVFKLSPSAKLG